MRLFEWLLSEVMLFCLVVGWTQKNKNKKIQSGESCKWFMREFGDDE
jgi:hypothetical protein